MQSIIIVDDMNEHIQYIKNIIQDMSYSFRIQTFHNIQAFQSQIQQFDDDAIIIMDILLGQNDGIELAKQLNQLQRHFQIIFVSSYLEKATLKASPASLHAIPYSIHISIRKNST